MLNSMFWVLFNGQIYFGAQRTKDHEVYTVGHRVPVSPWFKKKLNHRGTVTQSYTVIEPQRHQSTTKYKKKRIEIRCVLCVFPACRPRVAKGFAGGTQIIVRHVTLKTINRRRH